MKRLFFVGKITELVAWLDEQTGIYKDCTVYEFIADQERRERAFRALNATEKTS